MLSNSFGDVDGKFLFLIFWTSNKLKCFTHFWNHKMGFLKKKIYFLAWLRKTEVNNNFKKKNHIIIYLFIYYYYFLG